MVLESLMPGRRAEKGSDSLTCELELRISTARSSHGGGSWHDYCRSRADALLSCQGPAARPLARYCWEETGPKGQGLSKLCSSELYTLGRI
jgi:hypothetical protein